MLQGLELRKVTPHCGAEVSGIDLSQPLDAPAVAALQSALAENCVLFFRDQAMTPEQHKALGRQFGELHLHPAWPRLVEGHPELTRPDASPPGCGYWTGSRRSRSEPAAPGGQMQSFPCCVNPHREVLTVPRNVSALFPACK